MKFYINNHEYEVVAQGGGCIIRTERGEFRCNWEGDPEIVEVDSPYLFHDAMAPVCEGQTIKSFEEFEDLFFSGDEEQDRLDYDFSVDAARRWAEVSDQPANEILTYLEEQYGI